MSVINTYLHADCPGKTCSIGSGASLAQTSLTISYLSSSQYFEIKTQFQVVKIIILEIGVSFSKIDIFG